MINKEVMIAYKNELIENYAPASVNAMLAAINGFCRFMSWGEYTLKLLHIQRRVFAEKEKELSLGEYRALVEAAERTGQKRLSLILQLIASTGLRVSEVRYITMEAVRRKQAEIHLKGKIRVILLPDKMCKKLEKYSRHQGLISGPIFITKNGRPLDRKEIWSQMKRLCISACVSPEKVFPHNLRRLFARSVYAVQKDIIKLADLLGHSSVETTRIYLLSSGWEHRKAIERLHLIC